MGWDMSKGFEGIDHNFLTGKLEDVIQWSRSKSSWPGMGNFLCAAV